MKETSKKLLVFFCTLFLASIVCALVWAWMGKDTSVFAYVIPATGGTAATSAGLYYNKAKYENLAKGKMRFLEWQAQKGIKIEQSFDDEVSYKLDSELREAINNEVSQY